MLLLDFIVMGVLTVLSVIDIRRKSIGIGTMIGLGGICVLYAAYKVNQCGWNKNSLIGTAAFSVFLLLLSVGVKALGLGDVGVLLMLICVKGLIFAVSVFVTAITLMPLSMIFMLRFRKVTRKSSVPFIPYLCVSSLGVMLCG